MPKHKKKMKQGSLLEQIEKDEMNKYATNKKGEISASASRGISSSAVGVLGSSSAAAAGLGSTSKDNEKKIYKMNGKVITKRIEDDEDEEEEEEEEIDSDGEMNIVDRVNMKAAVNDDDDEEEDDDENEGSKWNAKASNQVMRLAREQIEEEGLENEEEDEGENKKAKAFSSLMMGGEDEDNENDDGSELDKDKENDYMNEDQYADLEVDEADEAVLEHFMNPTVQKRRTLGDIIMEKLKEKKENDDSSLADGGSVGGVTNAAQRKLSPQMVEVYTSVGKLLSRYRSGKVPKALKLIPVMRNWEEVLYLTRPDEWTPHSMFVATRIFASNLNPRMAQRFFNLVLLPAVRNDIRANGKLNYHYYIALQKAVFKPAAFFKGIIIPLCESGDCSLREATIIGSVLAKISVPMMHSAAAMLKIASIKQYNGAASLFLKVLMNKKYSLPYKVIDAIAMHFISFQKETRPLPILWHQAFLVFAQRYKYTVSAEQKEALKMLLKKENLHHHQITPEIRRELFTTMSREQQQIQDQHMKSVQSILEEEKRKKQKRVNSTKKVTFGSFKKNNDMDM